MTHTKQNGVIVPFTPKTCGNLATFERDRLTGQTDRNEERKRAWERRVQEARRRKFAFALAVLIVAGLLAGLMPWSGTAPELPAEVPNDTGKAISAAGLTAGQTFVEEETRTTPAAYIPPAAEVEALAKMLYGEARGIASDTEKAACVWAVLNRVDDPRFPDTVLEVLEEPYQFAGYSAEYPVIPELATLAADVLKRYHAEKNGETNVGRVLPAEYCFFTGDGKNNHFTNEWKNGDTWGWTLESPYKD